MIFELDDISSASSFSFDAANDAVPRRCCKEWASRLLQRDEGDVKCDDDRPGTNQVTTQPNKCQMDHNFDVCQNQLDFEDSYYRSTITVHRLLLVGDRRQTWTSITGMCMHNLSSLLLLSCYVSDLLFLLILFFFFFLLCFSLDPP